MGDIDYAFLLRYRCELAEVSPRIARRVTSLWKGLLRFARIKLWLQNVPDFKFPRLQRKNSAKRERQLKTREQALSIADLEAILSAATDDDLDLIVLAIGLALRSQEIRGAGASAICLDHHNKCGQFVVEAVINSDGKVTASGKTPNARRAIDFGATLYNYFVSRETPDGSFIVGGSESSFPKDELNKRFQALCMQAGVTRVISDPDCRSRRKTVPKCSVRMLRRLGASIWVIEGSAAGEIRTRMGHATEATSYGVYFYDPRTVCERKPPPVIGPCGEASFFYRERSLPVRTKLSPPTKAPRISKKRVSRAVGPFGAFPSA
ncbi:hypothetical protein [Devosia sp. 1566]|uniref:hypothetical protein n=1 Tax=Devosia sp. 1566 TaxID=2499144 RepID=UPI000FD89A5A|nr:hypothetical protein [Devosia sp. 1566]